MNASIRPTDIDLICRALQLFSSVPDSYFEDADPNGVSLIRNAVQGLPVKLRFRSTSLDYWELLAISMACSRASVLPGFSLKEQKTLRIYEDRFHILLLEANRHNSDPL